MVTGINGSLKAIGYALLVLFFLVGVVKTCGSFAEIKSPEHALKLFVRFAIAKGVITYGLDLMTALFKIVQGIVTTIIGSGGLNAAQAVTLPYGMITTVEGLTFLESIPAWAVSLIMCLVVFVLTLVMVMSVYGRFFPALSLYCNRARPAIYLRRRAVLAYWQIIPEIVCRRLSGGSDHRACVYHILGVFRSRSGCDGRRKRRGNRLDVYGRANL